MNFQKTIKSVALTTLMVASAAVQAQAGKSPFSYDYIDVEAVRAGGDNSPDVFSYGVSGSKLISQDVFVLGSLSRARVDVAGDPSFTSFGIGLGARVGLSPNADLFASISYNGTQSSDLGDSKGYLLPIGVRFQALNNVEIGGSFYFMKDGEDRLRGAVLGASYSLSKELEVGLDRNQFSGDSEGHLTRGYVRYNF